MSAKVRPLGISQYKSRFDKGKTLNVSEMEWEDLVTMMSTFKVTPESFAEYQAMESLDKLSIKDTGWFVGGVFNPPHRKTFNLQYRSILCLDLDHLESWDIGEILETYGEYAYLVHSSHSHSEEQPRLRLIIPLSRDVTPEEYEPLARMVANMLDMDMFDDTTYQFSRIMFLPSRSMDAPEYLEVNEGDWLDPDVILGLYEDVEDYGSWPRSSRQTLVRPSASKAQDPFTKPGIIGAFNRAHSIPEAIEEYGLPYEESGQGDGRYTYTDGTSADGAIYYADDGHLFSHHESDPAHGNQNAWDLVRLHRFGDDEEGDTSPLMQRPSMQQMVLLAGSSPLVTAELACEMFDDCSEVEDEETSDEVPPVPKAKAITFDEIHEWIREQWNSTVEDAPTNHLIEQFNIKVAAAGLRITQVERLAMLFQNFLKDTRNERISKAALLKDISATSKDLVARGSEGDELKDIQLEFLSSFIDKYYASGAHIRRTGKQWWSYNGTHWVQRAEEYIQGQLVEHLIALRTDPKMRKQNKALAAAVGESQTSSIQASLWSMFQSMRTYNTESSGSESDPMGLMRTNQDPAINCANGTIRFRGDGKHKLFPSKPLDLYTSSIDVEYDKDAECPVWDQFCTTTFSQTSDPLGMKRHLEELMGYILNQGRDLRAWVLFYGGTGSGKSTVGKVLDELLGDSAKNMSMGNYTGDNSHATAGLIGVQMLLDDDYKAGQLLDDGFLKAVSEEKRMEANPKGRDEFPFVAKLVPVILSNSMPTTRDTSGALADRALVFPFAHMVPRGDRDTRLARKLAGELPGIFARCVHAYGQLVKRGDWLFPADCTTAWRRWINQSNPLNLFITDCLIPDTDSMVKSGDVWGAYKLWWNEETGDSGKRSQLHRNTFYERLENALGQSRNRHRRHGVVWNGYKLDKKFVTEFEEDAAEWDD